MSDITVIQSHWRGYLTRKSTKPTRTVVQVAVTTAPVSSSEMGPPLTILTDSPNAQSKRRLMAPPRTPPRMNSEKMEPQDILPQSSKRTFERVPFSKNHDLYFIVDGAIGLPMTTTITRVRAELHFPTKEIVSIVSPWTYAESHSEFCNPQYALKMQWKGQLLHQTLTIICRIETLESPNLQPRVLGIASLRLGVDSVGMQPLSELIASDGRPTCFFNAGQFMAPVLFGNIPNDIAFVTEVKLQKAMAHIDGAYLRMGIIPVAPNEKLESSPFMSNKNLLAARASMVSFHREINTAMNLSVDPLSIGSRSNLAVVLKTYLTSKEALIPLKIPSALLDRFRQGSVFTDEEKDLLTNEIRAWVRQRFDGNDTASTRTNKNNNNAAVTPPQPEINPRYLLEYNESIGMNLALDMLFNMPERKKLIAAAERAAHILSIRSGLLRGWDNKINFYKTIFRYLPGSIPLSTSSLKEEPVLERVNEHSRESIVVDDASVKPNLHNSTEQGPVYLDDFSSTENMKLGPHACLLIVVTAVDILTSKKLAQQQQANENNESNSVSGGGSHYISSFLSPANSRSSLFSNNDDAAVSERQAKRAKLKGLLGIYVAKQDPKATWWGVLPLFSRFPSTALAATIATDMSSGISVKQRTTVAQRETSDFTFQGSENITPHADGDLASLTSLPLYVNSGVHQIPLFKGLPPDEMIAAGDPMAWLLAKVNYQMAKQAAQLASRSSIPWMLRPLMACMSSSSAPSSSSPSSAAQTPTSTATTDGNDKVNVKTRRKSRKTADIYLSDGASVFIRVIDPRLKRLAPVPVATDPNRPYHGEVLTDILQHHALAPASGGEKGSINMNVDASRLRNLKQTFQYAAGKFSKKRTLKMAVPETIDTTVLVKEINTKFYEAISS